VDVTSRTLTTSRPMENPYAAPKQLEYDPGAVKWWQFLWSTVVALVAAGALALVLHLLFRKGLYFVIWVPAIAAMVLSAMLFWSVQVGHCRSRWMAAVIAVLAANVMYWGQYYFDMVERRGGAIAYRLDLLPGHIAWRKSIEIHEGGNPARFGARNAPKATPGLNWFNSALELSTVLLFTIAAAVASASRPYCTHCREWMRRDAQLLPEGAWQPLLEAIEGDSLDDLLGLPEVSPFTHRRFTAVTVAWCPPRRGRAAKCPAYLSIKEVRYGGGLGQLNQVDLSYGRTRLRMHPLTKRQIAALRPCFLNMSYSAVGCDALPPERREA